MGVAGPDSRVLFLSADRYALPDWGVLSIADTLISSRLRLFAEGFSEQPQAEHCQVLAGL